MSDTDIVERLREIGAISANWAITDEAEIRHTCRKAADTIERQEERYNADVTHWNAVFKIILDERDALRERVKALEEAIKHALNDGRLNGTETEDVLRAALQGTGT